MVPKNVKSGFGTRYSTEAGRVLRHMLKKACIVMNSGSDSGEGPERKNYCRKSFSFLREHLNNPEQKVVWNTDDKAILIKPRVKMKTILLESGEKVILVIQ